MRLGIKMFLNLTYTVLLTGVFRKPKNFNQFNFRAHSLGVVYLTRSLAHIVKISYEEIEFAYICRLMHDVGIPVFDHLIPDQYTELLESIKSTDRTLAEHEEETFGITHAELGKRFIERWWPVSPDMVKAIGTHHDDTGTDGNVKHIAHLLTTANLLANQNGFGNGIVPGDAAPLEYSVLVKLDLDFDELEILVENMKERLDAAKSFLKGS